MIALPELKNGEWTILVLRKNGTKYCLHSHDKQSVIDYRNELLAYARSRARAK